MHCHPPQPSKMPTGSKGLINHISNTHIGQQVPKQLLTQQYIISMNNEEPIHASSAYEEFQRLRQSHASIFITIQLSKRDPIRPTNYKELRTKFDQMRPVIASTNHNHQNTQLQAINDLSMPTFLS